MSSDDKFVSYYRYDPSHVLPAVFAGVVFVSLVAHIWQNLLVREYADILKTRTLTLKQSLSLLEGDLLGILGRLTLHDRLDPAMHQ